MVQAVFARRFFILLACSLCLVAFGENEPLDAEKWAELTEGKSYAEKAREPRSNGSLPHFDFGINGEAIKYAIFIFVFALLIYFLVRYLLSLQSNAAQEEEMPVEVNSLKEAEENPMQADLEKLIAKLTAESKYREATRGYFLLVLQRLYRNRYIDWQKPKTNFDYVKEVHEHTFYPAFNNLTAYFEMIWYGDNNVEEADFIAIENEFKHLVTTIGDARKK
jgi:hypothetical protein